MVTTLTTPDSTLAAIEAALPIDPQPYTVGDRPTGLIVVDVVNRPLAKVLNLSIPNPKLEIQN